VSKRFILSKLWAVDRRFETKFNRVQGGAQNQVTTQNVDDSLIDEIETVIIVGIRVSEETSTIGPNKSHRYFSDLYGTESCLREF
jgi:hypothetical protein